MPLFDDWHVRSLDAADAEALACHANNRHVSINLRDSFPFPYTLNDARKWLRSVKKHQPECGWAIASSHELIGGIGIHIQPDIYRHSAEMGYWLGEQFWGKGIASAAVKAATEYVFANFELVRIFAGVFEWNPASVRVLEKSGFTLESRMKNSVLKDGKHIDQLMYVMLREEWERRRGR